MSKRESFSRYNLIIKKIRKAPATFSEMDDYLDRESELQAYNFRVSKRTFQRDLDDIRSLFNIDIQYDFSRKIYYINEEDQPEVNDRILEAFDTFNALNVADGLSKYIHFEKRRPQGTENLYGVLHAIKNSLRINFSYQKFWEDEAENRTVEPYALKESENRWYVMAKDMKDERIKSFGLDQLSNLDITKRKFHYPKDLDIEESYRYSFGIISPNNKQPEDIILSFEPIQGKYVKSLPIHNKQEILIDNEKELRIKLKLCITFDLIMELLKYGESMKVLQPQSLATKIKAEHQKAFRQY